MSRFGTIIEKFDLKKHPEGGYFAETYRSAERCNPAGAKGASRSTCTAIYYLLPAGTQSDLHRLKSDELWHFYLGGPLNMHFFYQDGSYEMATLGTDIENDESPQIFVPGGTWFGARPAEGVEFTLVGCTVSPGFEFDDFELGDRATLLEMFPDHASLVRELTSQPS